MSLSYDERIKKICNNNSRNDYEKTIALLNLLRRELAHFNYNKNFYNLSHFIDKINEIRPRLSNKNQKKINGEIIKLHSQVRELIKKRDKSISNNNINFIELQKIIDNLEGMNLSYVYDYIDQYDGNAYSLLRYLLFEEKSLVFVKYALDKYPHLVNTRDKEGNCIILDIVDKYIEAIDRYTKDGILTYNDDLFYYDDILECILKSEKIKYPEEVKREALTKVYKFLDNYEYSNISREVKEKLIFWTNELKDKLEEKEREETLSHLSYKTDITINFNEAILSEARRFNPLIISHEMDKREKIKNEYIVTIDGNGAEEIDDGLSVSKLDNGNYLLGVHIADPTGYINKNSILYDESYRNTTSIYLRSPVARAIYMYPEEYAKDYMSLKEGQPRLTTSYYLEITPDGEILLDRCVFKKAVVKVDSQLTHDKFDELFKKGSSNMELDKTMYLLQEVSDALSKRVSINQQYRIAKRNASNPSMTNVIGNSNSDKIVENAMLAANTTVANYFAKNNLPFIYRGHEINQKYLDKISYFERQLKENPTDYDYDIFVKLLKETYPPAFYTTDSKIGHAGIGVSHYAHVTSPLRRFADSLATEALNLFYFDKVEDSEVIDRFTKKLEDGCHYINEKKTSIDYFTERYSKIKKLEKK